MWFALYEKSEVIYKLDSKRNRIVSYIDKTVTPNKVYYEEEGYTEEGYSEPIKFFENISYNSGGDSTIEEYGVSTAEYEAIVTVAKGLLPITETSLIWLHTPLTDGGTGKAIKEDADFRIIRVHESLNQSKYILAKVQK